MDAHARDKAPSPAALAALASAMVGDVVGPGDPAYAESRRVWNGSIDRRPAVIARCAGIEDVRAAVGFGRDHGLLCAVRGGGHSFPGLSVCDDGLVIDLGRMNAVRVDPDRGTARVGAGALLGDVDRATQGYGLAVPAGIVSHTGVAGLTLGGGIGWLMRKHGLTIDSLLSATVVTADGELVRASADENVDLFWGLRGGGGNFGVVTEFEFRLRHVGPEVVAGTVLWPMGQARRLLRFYREWIADAPDELTTIVVQRRAPDIDGMPPDVVGRKVVGVAVCHCGDVAAAERFLAPLRTFGAPVTDGCRRQLYLSHQTAFDASFRPGWWYYVRSCDVAALSDDVIDVVADHGERIASPISSLALWQLGGAVARVPDDATAYNGRGAAFTFNINGNSLTEDGFEDERRWARAYWSALAPHHTSVYVNFLMDEGQTRVRQAYGSGKYERLRALKQSYDPTNFFRLNQNIRPP